MVVISEVDLEPGTAYSPSELRSTFDKRRAGKGIEKLYDDNNDRFIRLFSKAESEYSDDLESDPMRYVGEKDFNNPSGDQILNRGNGALAESQDNDWPIFLFEKVSEDPVRHLFHGKVEVVDFELNYRPQKGKSEYDFYLELADNEAETASDESESDDDLAPGQLREIEPGTRDVPSSEEEISYESNKKTQAEATNTHEDTVSELRDWLESGRWECKETDETDILAYTKTEALVIEVKSIDDSNERKQLRKAVGQLLENCYRDVQNRAWGEKELIACIALSQVPSDRFSGYIEFLRSQGIETIWRTDDGISGHPESITAILE